MKNRIAKIRNEKGLTLRQLGDKVGLGDNTISRYETGKREPKLETWQKLASALDVSVPYLQGENTPEVYLSQFMGYLDELKKDPDRSDYEKKALNYFDESASKDLCLKAITAALSAPAFTGWNPDEIMKSGLLSDYVLDAFAVAYQNAVKSTQNLLWLTYDRLNDLASTVENYALIDKAFYTPEHKSNEHDTYSIEVSHSQVTTEAVNSVIRPLEKLIAQVENNLGSMKDGPEGIQLSVSQLHRESLTAPSSVTSIVTKHFRDSQINIDDIHSSASDVSDAELHAVLVEWYEGYINKRV